MKSGHMRSRAAVAVFWSIACFLSPAAMTRALATDLYWVEYAYEGFDRFSLHRTTIRGTNTTHGVEIIHQMGEQPAYGSLVIQGKRIFWRTYSGQFMQARLDGTAMKSAVNYSTKTGFQLQGADIDRDGVYSYWPYADPGVIRIGDFEGENQQDLIYTRLFQPDMAIALDEVHGRIYWIGAWSGGDTGIIQRASLNGRNVKTLVGSGLFFDDYPVDLALDLKHRRMYWINMANGAIQRATLNGLKVEDILTGISAFSIALDVKD